MPHQSNIKPARLHWQLLLLLITILLIGTTAGCLRSKPLSLLPGETIRGLFRVDGPGPFHIGDSIPLTLTVDAKTGFTYQIPELNGPALRGLELKQKLLSKTEKLPGGFRQTTRYLLTGWQVGQYTLPGSVVFFESSTNVQGTLKLAPIKIELVSVLPKDKSEAALLAMDIKGIKYPLGLPPRYWLLKWFLLGTLILIIILLLLRLYRRFIIKSDAAKQALEIEPAHIIALRRLAALKETTLLEQGDYKTFYSELSECIREYIENRYLVRALEMTTEEFLAQLTTEDYLDKENQSVLKSFLLQSDLIKFAKQSPAPDEAGQALNNIEQLVAATKETPIPTNNPSTETPDETLV
jgi:hypothetical protein